MQKVDREFAIIAGLVLAFAVYQVATTSLGPGFGIIALLAACIYGINRLGKGASRSTRLAAGLFALGTIWSFRQSLIDISIGLWWLPGAEFALAIAAAFWLVIRPGWIPAAIIALYTFLGLIGALRSLVWIMTDEFSYPTSLALQVFATILLRFAVIGLLLRAVADGFGKSGPASSAIEEVFD